MKRVVFSETIAASDLKVSRCRHIIEFMKVCEYYWPKKKSYYKLKKKCCGSNFSRFNKDHIEDKQIPK